MNIQSSIQQNMNIARESATSYSSFRQTSEQAKQTTRMQGQSDHIASTNETRGTLLDILV